MAGGKNAIENNRLSTPFEKIRIKELAAQGIATEEELKAIACALHKCSAQYVEGSPEFIAAKALEEEGMKEEYTALREQLANQKYIISYTDPRTGKEVEIVVADLFNYTTLDYILDGATYSDGKFHLTDRGLGALQAAGGLFNMGSGVAACTSIFGCFGGVVVSTIGADQFWAGYNRLLSGQEQKTAGAALLEILGVPPEYSEIIYGFTDAAGVAKIAFKSTKTGAVVEVALDKNAKDAVIRSGTIDSKTGKFEPTEVAAGKGTGLTSTQIKDVKTISAGEANKPFIERGWSAPYDSSTQVRQFTAASELNFVRVHTNDNVAGQFIVRADEIKGMTPQQIQQHLALPTIPTFISDVKVPSGTRLQVGRVAPQPNFGAPNKGGTQYQLIDKIPLENFHNTRPLK